jgi:hypothetical protein
MRRGRLLGLTLTAALVPATAPAQEPTLAPVRVEDSATVQGEAGPARPGRLRLFLDDTVRSPTLVPRLAWSAALDHRDGSPSAWGSGADAYGKRMAARAGLVMAQTGVQHGTAALLRVDPRGDRSRCACTHPLKRAAHAMSRTFVTRDARGRTRPNIPLVAGAAGGAAMARAWYPPGEGPARDAARFAAMSVVGQMGANVFREFAPDLKRLVRRAPKPRNEPRER